MPITVIAITVAFATSICTAQTHPAAFEVTFFDHTQLMDNSNPDCLTVRELVQHAMHNSFDSQEKAEQLYQARMRIGQQLGNMTPQLNLATTIAAAGSELWHVVPALVGFLFPSNWYNWKQSKHLYEAQRYSYMTLLGNQINTLTSLYINIHHYQRTLQILRHYYKEIKRVIAEIKKQKREQNRIINAEMMGILLSIKARIDYDKEVLKRNLREVLPQLAYAANYEKKWANFCIKPLRATDLTPTKLTAGKLLPEIWFKSTELASLEFARRAARYSLKSTVFRFFMPESSGNSLGLSYYYRLKISKSKIAEINVQLSRTKSNLKMSAHQAINDSNSSQAHSKKSSKSIKALIGSKEAFIDNIVNTVSFFDLEKALRFFEYSMSADLRLNKAIHLHFVAKNNLARLRWKGTQYASVAKFIPPQKIARLFTAQGASTNL